MKPDTGHQNEKLSTLGGEMFKITAQCQKYKTIKNTIDKQG